LKPKLTNQQMLKKKAKKKKKPKRSFSSEIEGWLWPPFFYALLGCVHFEQWVIPIINRATKNKLGMARFCILFVIVACPHSG
jgi:hypothetical protein